MIRPAGTIVVADDLDANLDLFVRLLTRDGYTVFPARDGETALDLVVRQLPDLVLSEVPPNASAGKQLAALLRVAFGDQAPPFIALVQNKEDKLPREAVHGVVVKPIEEASLIAAIEPHLPGRGR